MLLSIIIPVYNIENFIGNCIQSVINQNIDKTNYEIIIVNYGSTDKSLEISEKYAVNEPNIVILSQENKGLGNARMSGLQIARGEYLYFLDGDDYLAHNTLGRVLKYALVNKLDIAGFDVERTTTMNNIVTSTPSGEVTTSEIVNGIDFMGNCNHYRVEVWWYLIRRDFFRHSGAKFEDKRFVNDSYFTPTLFMNARRVGYVNMDIYRYVERRDSITKKNDNVHHIRHIKDSLFAISEMARIISRLRQDKQINNLTIQKIKAKQESYSIFILIRFAKSELNISELSNTLSALKASEAYPVRHLRGKDYPRLTFKVLSMVVNYRLTLILFIRTFRLINRLKPKNSGPKETLT